MKAIRIHEYGPEENLKYEDAPVPEVGPGEVLIEVYATSVNHLETMVASGKMKENYPVAMPWTPGYDFAGRIDYIGQDVKGFQPGDEVYGKCNGGSYAEYMVAKQEMFAPMPANLSFAEAASVPHVALTAWEAVYEHGLIEPGQNVLIQGAGGAVGTFAVQFAKLSGAFIYAVDNGKNREFLESLGVDVMIDYKTDDFTEIAKDIDLVLDFVGKDTPSKCYPLMKKGGRLVTTAAQIDPQEAEKYGVTALLMSVEPDRADLSEITTLIESGKVIADVAAVYPLEQAAEAWRVFEKKSPMPEGKTHGKIVLETQKL